MKIGAVVKVFGAWRDLDVENESRFEKPVARVQA